VSEDLLYRRDLLRLAADASHAGHLSAPHASGAAHNPACGDRVSVDLNLEDGRIVALAHDTHACVLAQASAALLANLVPGRTRQDLETLSREVENMLAGGPLPAPAYAAFRGVTALPGRHTCVMLPLRAAIEALNMLERQGS
jgi:NifU-like protein involved in Fe-S cluster formation